MTPTSPSSSRDGPSGRPAQRAARRPSLYVTVLSLAVAAIAATWLPFSVLYINALSKRPVTPAALVAPQSGAHAVSVHTAPPTPLTTRAS